MSSSEADAAAGGGNEKKSKPQQQQTTKRQRRLKPNPSNTWPQQPKIQSPAARAKAYLRVAGFHNNTKPTQNLNPEIDLQSPEIKFGRMLGGTNPRKRHAAVQKLQFYLKARCDMQNTKGGISEMDLLKLWKGLWFTLYMADKVPVQDELSKHLSKLIWCVAGTEEEDEYAAQEYMKICGESNDEGQLIMEDVTVEEMTGEDDDESDRVEEEEEEDDDDNHIIGSSDAQDEDSDDDEVVMKEIVNTLQEESESENDDDDDDADEEEDDALFRHLRGAHLASLFLKTFFVTIGREWSNMDKYRVDKFYTLIRLMMQQVYKYMAIRHWNIGIIRLFNDVLFEQVLSQVGGLGLHLIDLALDELAQANAEAPMPLTEATFLDCLEPFFAMLQTSPDKVVHGRIQEGILTKFLHKYSIVANNEDDESFNVLIMDQVHVGTVAQFIFELASDVETQDRYRKDLYDMHKIYMKRIKQVGRDVVLDMNGGIVNENEEEYEMMQEEEEGGIMGDKVEKTVEHDDKDEEEEDQAKAEAKQTTKEVESLAENEASKEKSTKKKKKKKKKKRNLEEADEERLEKEEEGTPDPPSRLGAEQTTPNAESTEEEEAVATEKPPSEKKKKKRKLEEDDKENPWLQFETKEASDERDWKPFDSDVSALTDHLEKPKKRKKKKKKRKEEDGEEVITISVSEQKEAAKKSEKQKEERAPVKNKKVRKESKREHSEKRVKFGTRNRSKSYKASMKALTTTEPPNTAERSPDQSILLNRNKPGPVAKKTNRRTAVDYF